MFYHSSEAFIQYLEVQVKENPQLYIAQMEALVLYVYSLVSEDETRIKQLGAAVWTPINWHAQLDIQFIW